MSLSAKQPRSIQICYALIKSLNWRSDHPRITSWLSRVGIALTGQPYLIDKSTIPETVYTSLTKFLDLYYKCDRTLMLLRWDWNHPEVKKVQRKYGCEGQLLDDTVNGGLEESIGG